MLNLLDLTEAVRQLALDELQQDIDGGRLYTSPRLNAAGRQSYPGLLREALASHNDGWLAGQLGRGHLFEATESRRTKSGVTQARVPHTAPQTLAEGEFNRFYIRGLCRYAQSQGIDEVVVYRAKQVDAPRPESQARLNARINATRLLDDLRANNGAVDSALGVPAGPNSGLSVRLA